MICIPFVRFKYERKGENGPADVDEPTASEVVPNLRRELGDPVLNVDLVLLQPARCSVNNFEMVKG